jgi:hypothetical protein
MKEERKDVSINHQGDSRQEGQSSNTTPQIEGNGQRNSNNNNQPMTNMLKDSEEQKAGREKNEKDEGDA